MYFEAQVLFKTITQHDCTIFIHLVYRSLCPLLHIFDVDFLRSLQYIKTDCSILVEVLEPLLSVKAKEEIATSLVRILQKLGCAQDFLSDIVMAEVDKLGRLARSITKINHFVDRSTNLSFCPCLVSTLYFLAYPFVRQGTSLN